MKAIDAYREMMLRLRPVFGERSSMQMAKIYFEDVFGMKHFHQELELSKTQIDQYQFDTGRLLMHIPLAYVTRRTQFLDFFIKLDESVLIPRPETEELCRWIIDDYSNDKRESLKILDIGTGSGCIALALAKHLNNSCVKAIDNSEAALAIAKENAVQLNLEDRIEFECLDILEDQSIRFSDFDIVVSNPPYIDHKEHSLMSNSTKQNEPEAALFAEEDGLFFYKNYANRMATIKDHAPVLYLELNEFKLKEIRALFNSERMNVEVRKDMQGKDRMLKLSI